MWTYIDTWIIVIGVLAAVTCAIPGIFLVLKRMSLLGDGITHAVLPGIALAFLISGSRNGLVLFIGAIITAILFTFISDMLHKRMQVDANASLGVVFSLFFAVGLVAIVRGANAVDLDPSCVLFGSLELAPLHTLSWMPGVPVAFLRLLILLVVQLLFVGLFYKELNLFAFDPTFARTKGYRTKLLHYVFISMVALTTVSVFEITGSILTIAVLVLPGTIALLLSHRLTMVLLLSVLIAIMAAGGGYTLSVLLPSSMGLPDSTVAGGIAVTLFLGLLVAITFTTKRRHA